MKIVYLKTPVKKEKRRIPSAEELQELLTAKWNAKVQKKKDPVLPTYEELYERLKRKYSLKGQKKAAKLPSYKKD